MQDDQREPAVAIQERVISGNAERLNVIAKEIDAAHAALDKLGIPKELHTPFDLPYRPGALYNAENPIIERRAMTLAERIAKLGDSRQMALDFSSRESARATRANEAVRALTAWVADQEKP